MRPPQPVLLQSVIVKVMLPVRCRLVVTSTSAAFTASSGRIGLILVLQFLQLLLLVLLLTVVFARLAVLALRI